MFYSSEINIASLVYLCSEYQMNKHDFIHTLQFYKSVMEKPNYDNFKTKINANFLQLSVRKKGFLPLEKFTIPQMRYLSLEFPHNLATDKKTSNKISQIFSTAHMNLEFTEHLRISQISKCSQCKTLISSQYSPQQAQHLP